LIFDMVRRVIAVDKGGRAANGRFLKLRRNRAGKEMEALGRLQAVIALVSWKGDRREYRIRLHKEVFQKRKRDSYGIAIGAMQTKQRSAEANRCCALHSYGQDHALRPLQR
jgi:hypothetical protein